MGDWIANEIEGSKKFMQQLVQENSEMRARIAELEAWNAKCEEARNWLIERNRTLAGALKPFADIVRHISPNAEDTQMVRSYVSDLRAARAALEKKND